MATTCPTCRNSVIGNPATCPHCFGRLTGGQPARKPANQPAIIGGIIAFAVVGVIGAVAIFFIATPKQNQLANVKELPATTIPRGRLPKTSPVPSPVKPPAPLATNDEEEEPLATPSRSIPPIPVVPSPVRVPEAPRVAHNDADAVKAGLVAAIKSRLGDPDAMQVVEWGPLMPGSNGSKVIGLTFRYRNKFGAMTITDRICFVYTNGTMDAIEDDWRGWIIKDGVAKSGVLDMFDNLGK